MANNDHHISRLARWLGIYAFATGVITLIGWFAYLPRLTDWPGFGISMVSTTAIEGACTGVAVILLLQRNRPKISIVAGGILGAIVTLTAALTLLEHLTGINLGIDTLLVGQPWGTGAVSPGRMGPPACVSFMLLGIALVTLAGNSRFRRAIPAIGLTVAGIATLGLIGYLFEADPLFAAARYTAIAFQTATMILALALAVIASVPDLNPVRTLRENSSAGLLLRRVLPLTIFLPVALGWLFVHGQDAGWFDRGLGMALIVLNLLAVLCGQLWESAKAVAKHEEVSCASQERLSRLISLMPAAIYTCDAAGRISFFNRLAVQVWDREPAIGMDDEKFCGSFRLWNLDGSPLPREETPMAAAIKTGASVRNRQLIVERPDGSRVIASVNIDPLFDERGKICGAINVFQDITEQKRIEEQQRAVYELAATVNRARALPEICEAALQTLQRSIKSDRIVILLYDTTRRVTYFNSGNESFSIASRRALESFSPWTSADKNPEPVRFENLKTTSPDSALREAVEREGISSMAFVPLTYEQRLLGEFIICHDSPHSFTAEELLPAQAIANQMVFAIERQRTGEALERLVNERTASLRNAIAQLEEFSYTVSHDLRAPLRGMKVYTEVLLEDFANSVPPEAADYLRRIGRNADRLDKMILDVLTFSRIARTEVQLERVALDKLVRQIVDEYPGLQFLQPQIEIDPLPDVLGHEPSLTQAFSNLLNNALKFVAPNVTPRVRVRSERLNGHVRIWVEDNGIGIEPKHQGRLFSMFERIHPNSKYEGTGVGLAIVRKAVERMGGSVGVESDGKNGSRFWVNVPAAEAAK